MTQQESDLLKQHIDSFKKLNDKYNTYDNNYILKNEDLDKLLYYVTNNNLHTDFKDYGSIHESEDATAFKWLTNLSTNPNIHFTYDDLNFVLTDYDSAAELQGEDLIELVSENLKKLPKKFKTIDDYVEANFDKFFTKYYMHGKLTYTINNTKIVYSYFKVPRGLIYYENITVADLRNLYNTFSKIVEIIKKELKI